MKIIPLLLVMLVLVGCLAPGSNDSADFMGQIYGMRLRQEFESRQADIEFKRSEAELMRQHAKQLRGNLDGPVASWEDWRVAIIAARWASSHPRGGVYRSNGESRFFTAEEIENVRENSRTILLRNLSLFREALRFATDHPRGGRYIDPVTTRSVYFDAASVAQIGENARAGIEALGLLQGEALPVFPK